METRVAIIGIIVENPDQVGKLNAILHEYSQYIIGRMGIPYHERNISIISVAGIMVFLDMAADVFRIRKMLEKQNG